MNRDDQQFWDRLADMPWTEAEQECVLRREDLCLQLGMLQRERLASKSKKDDDRIAAAVTDVQGQLSLIKERLMYLRRALDTIRWRNAVVIVLGNDAYAQVSEYIAKTEEGYRQSNPAPKVPA